MRAVREAKESGYYIAKRDMIVGLGYNDPVTDTDPRQREVWKELEDGDYELEIRQGYDCSNLAPHTSLHFKYFQTRANTEEDAESFFEEFYVLNKKQERIILGMEIDGKVYVFMGNRRIRAHEMGIDKGNASRCTLVLVDRDGLTADEKCVLAHRWARKGNKQQHTVRDEQSSDYPFQLKTAYTLECTTNPAAFQWNTDQKIEWGRKWVIDEISADYVHESRKHLLGNIVHAAFAEHRGNSLPFPKDEEIELQLKNFWPKMQWSAANGNVLKISCCTRIDKIIEKMRVPWMNREAFTEVRKHAHLVLRAGSSLDREITSSDTVDTERERAIKLLTAYNINPNVIGAGMVLPTRIMFVQQMDMGDYEAWEWNFEDECYDKVEKVPNE